MSTFRVYYVTLSDADRTQVNEMGWGCPVGFAYMKATMGKGGEILVEDAITYALYEEAAMMEAENLSDVWENLQNMEVNWMDKPNIGCMTKFPRSMIVGDIIESVFQDYPSVYHVVLPYGFRPLSDDETMHLERMMK